MKFEIKKYRSCRGMEGDAFSFDLFVDGKRYAEVIDEASGGPLLIHWGDQRKALRQFQGPLEQEVTQHIESLPPRSLSEVWGENWRTEQPWLLKENPDGTEKWDLESFLYHMVADFESERTLRRLCSKKTLFRKPGEPYQEGEYNTLKLPYSPEVRMKLQAKYPGVEILNDKFLRRAS